MTFARLLRPCPGSVRGHRSLQPLHPPPHPIPHPPIPSQPPPSSRSPLGHIPLRIITIVHQPGHPLRATRPPPRPLPLPPPHPDRQRHAHCGPGQGARSQLHGRLLTAPRLRGPRTPPASPLPAAAGCRPRHPSPGSRRPPLQLAARSARARRRALIGCPGPAAALSGRQIRWVRAAEAPGAPAGAERGARSPAGPSERPGAQGSAPRRAGAAVLAAMCSQLWFLTDRRICEDYPQVQILRALQQRCSERDVRFRAVFMDQIAVTVIGGHLGECGGPRESGEARRGPESRPVGARPGPPPGKSPSGP